MIMKHLDLFSGIGGFALAARWAGFKTIAFCEIEEYPRKVLKKNFPGVPIFKDVRELHAKDLPERPDIITGGYPCQPFSTAGKRRGDKDDRHLWPEMFRVVRECKPTWVTGENVAGHRTMGLDQVLSDLESENYTCWTFIIPACAVDAPHRRDRIWVVANSNNKRELQLTKSGDKERDRISNCCEDVADTSIELSRYGNIDDVTLFGNAEKKRTSGGAIQPEELWPVEPRVGRVVNGLSSRVDRLKGLGNAIVPQVAYQILRAIQSNK